MALPPFNDVGDLPIGVHRVSLGEAIDRLGTTNARRRAIGLRLDRIYRLSKATGHVLRFIVFGSFVTAKSDPNDVDVFLVMDDDFDAAQLSPLTASLFDHSAAQAQYGASIFWIRALAAWDGVDAAVEYWQVKRGGGTRGIVEIIPENTP